MRGGISSKETGGGPGRGDTELTPRPPTTLVLGAASVPGQALLRNSSLQGCCSPAHSRPTGGTHAAGFGERRRQPSVGLGKESRTGTRGWSLPSHVLRLNVSARLVYLCSSEDKDLVLLSSGERRGRR